MIKVSSFRVSVFSFMPELSVWGINFEFERSLACLVFCWKGPNWGNVIVLKRWNIRGFGVSKSGRSLYDLLISYSIQKHSCIPACAKTQTISFANQFPVPWPPLTETTLAPLFQLWVISGLCIVRCTSRMILDGIGLFIWIHKFDSNLKDAIVGWFTRGNFISGSILAYDFSIESPIPFSLVYYKCQLNPY